MQRTLCQQFVETRPDQVARLRKMKPGLDLAGRRQGYDVQLGAEGLE